ncbi:hypothetical protein Ctob_007479, partial [Chrysochromulina tobinii]
MSTYMQGRSSVAISRAQRADRAVVSTCMPGRSSVAINVPSRTSVHSGPTAPVFAMADWLIWWLRARLASAPAALA